MAAVANLFSASARFILKIMVFDANSNLSWCQTWLWQQQFYIVRLLQPLHYITLKGGIGILKIQVIQIQLSWGRKRRQKPKLLQFRRQCPSVLWQVI